MNDAPPPASPSRQERRKAETRHRIVRAADHLFEDQGYAETSMEDIARAADVGVRTIYLHFDSKAAIMLSYFDRWLDAFAEAITERPVEEPVSDTVRAALASLREQGWAERVEEPGARPHPLVEYLGSGPLDIAGHVMQRWMHVLARLSDDATQRSHGSLSPLDAHARAVAVFTVWISSLSAARERQRGVPLTPSLGGEVLGLTLLERIARGAV